MKLTVALNLALSRLYHLYVNERMLVIRGNMTDCLWRLEHRAQATHELNDFFDVLYVIPVLENSCSLAHDRSQRKL